MLPAPVEVTGNPPVPLTPLEEAEDPPMRSLTAVFESPVVAVSLRTLKEPPVLLVAEIPITPVPVELIAVLALPVPLGAAEEFSVLPLTGVIDPPMLAI